MSESPDYLDNLFNPRSIGIVGEVRNANSWSHQILNNLVDYQYSGEILPVAPGGGTILGHQIYQDVQEIQRNVDLLLLCTPIEQSVKIVEQVADDGPSCIAITASGQSVTAEQARQYVETLSEIASETDVRILGPSCSGVFSSTDRLNATSLPSVPGEEGNITFVSQSGAYGDLLFSQLEKRGLNVGKFISIGDQADISHVDVLSYLKDDTDTDVIALFVEEIQNGPEFLRVAGETTLNKPIVSFLVSRTESGLRSTMEGSRREAPKFPVYQAAFKQAGVQLFNDTDHFFDAITVFAGLEQRFPMSDEIGVLSLSEGPAVAACDAAEELGLSVEEFSDDFQDELSKALPESARSDNPVRIPPSTDDSQLRELAGLLAESDEVNGLLPLNIGFDNDVFASELIQAFDRELKPIVGFAARCDEVEKTFREHGIPLLPTPERAALGMSFLRTYRDLMADQKHKGLPDEQVFQQIQDGISQRRQRSADKIEQLDELDSKSFLQENDFPVVDEIVTESQKEAVNYARTNGLPVEAEVYQPGGQNDPELMYRDIDSIDNLESAYLSLRRRSEKEPILVRPSSGPSIHLQLKAVRDEMFGIVLSFGLGGAYSDVLSDISYRLAPIQKPEARKMIDEVEASHLLDGYQQYPSVDRGPVAELLMQIAHTMISNPTLQSIDANPVRARNDQVEVLRASVSRFPENDE
jgi:acetyltransferase